MVYRVPKIVYLFLIVSLLSFFGVFPLRSVKADLTNVKDTLSDSRPSTDANHTIVFALSGTNDLDENSTTTITFASGFDLSNIVYSDVDVSGSSSGEQCVNSVATSTCWGASVSGQVLTIVTPTGSNTYINGGETVTIEIGNHATAFSGSGSNQITNPSSENSYDIDISVTGSISGVTDTGSTKVAIISGVTVSATVDETLTFTISAVDAVDCTLGNSVTAVTTTASTVPFETMNANTFKKGCQDLAVSTNAGDGYSMTSQETDQLTNAGSDIIPDTTCDTASCTETTAGAWATATNNGFGHTCDGTDCVAAYSSAASYRQFASIGDAESAVIMQSNAGAVNNSTTTVVYQISISGLQEAGDYSNTVVYITTAQFD